MNKTEQDRDQLLKEWGRLTLLECSIRERFNSLREHFSEDDKVIRCVLKATIALDDANDMIRRKIYNEEPTNE